MLIMVYCRYQYQSTCLHQHLHILAQPHSTRLRTSAVRDAHFTARFTSKLQPSLHTACILYSTLLSLLLLQTTQVKSWLHGAEPLSGADIAKLVASQEGTLQAGGRISRDSYRYWLIEYLRRSGSTPHEAYVLGYNDNRERGGKVTLLLHLLELVSLVLAS
jgi:hypothetical protein